MVNKLKKIHFKFPLMLLTVAMCSLLFFAFESNKRNKPPRFRSDPQMVNIPGGAFYMGASDEQMDMSLMNRKKLVSIQNFWMDRTEVTNEQYRRFVNYVADSLKFMALYGGGISATEDTVNIDWNKVSKINMKSKAVLEKLN
jgi:formylglycine-generating enzyme required for sulfatase activity